MKRYGYLRFGACRRVWFWRAGVALWLTAARVVVSFSWERREAERPELKLRLVGDDE